MTNESVVLDLTPRNVRRAQKRGGSTFRGQAASIIATQVEGLPVGTTFKVGTVPGGAAPLIEFTGLPTGSRIHVRSLNGHVALLNPLAAAAAISYVAVGWLTWNLHEVGLGNPPYGAEAMHAAAAQFRTLWSYIFEGNNFTAAERKAIIAYTD